MITSNKILSLIEKYVNQWNLATGHLELYSNPTRSEVLGLKRMSKNKDNFNVRFIANTKTGIIYIWDAYLATHTEILSKLQLPTTLKDTPYLLLGIGKVDNNGTISLADIYFLQSEFTRMFSSPRKIFSFYDTLFGYSWEWVYPYINGLKDYLAKEKIEFEKLKSGWYDRNNKAH